MGVLESEWGWLVVLAILLGFIIGLILLLFALDSCTRPRHLQNRQPSSPSRDIEVGQLERNANVPAEPPKYSGT